MLTQGFIWKKKIILGRFTAHKDWSIKNNHSFTWAAKRDQSFWNREEPPLKEPPLGQLGCTQQKAQHQKKPPSTWHKWLLPAQGHFVLHLDSPGRDILALFRSMTKLGSPANAHQYLAYSLAWEQRQSHPVPEPRPLMSPSHSPALRRPPVYILLTSQT